MLRCGHDARPLEGCDECPPHERGEVGIFPVRLLDAPPADVARDVQYRREHLPHTAAPRLARDGARDASHELGVPRRRQRHRLRKHGRAGTRQPVHRLIEGNDGNTEPRALDEIPLNRVDAPGVGPGATAGVARVERPDLETEDAVRVVVG